MTSSCRICHNSEHLAHYTFAEKMTGSGEQFDYFQCPACGCLQIAEIPTNLSDYYAGDYYSYKPNKRFEEAKFRQWVDRHRVRYALSGSDLLGRLFSHLAKPLEYLPWVKQAAVNAESTILDVGSGHGRLLLRMALGGFSHLTGIDPFIERDIDYANGVSVRKTELDGLTATTAKFDLIMLHHSYEHMTDQLAALKSAAALLNPEGIILLRIPLCDSYAWEHYRENWVQLDAPRHLYLHSRRSVELLATKCGLSVQKVIYDSSKFQFTGSELYLRGIPLNASKRSKNIFSRAQLHNFNSRARQLNDAGRGDQAAFYLSFA